jgi:hypothetical protein
MEIKFLKEHLGYKKGAVDDVNDSRAKSWIAQGIAVEVGRDETLTPEAKELIDEGAEQTEKNERKIQREKNAHAGPKKRK